MEGYFLFLDKLNKLTLKERYKIIGKILEIKVKVFDLSINEGKIFIKVYDGEKYYQFCFIRGVFCEEYINISIKDRILVCRIFVDNLFGDLLNEKNFKKGFYSFLKIIVDGDISYFDSFL